MHAPYSLRSVLVRLAGSLSAARLNAAALALVALALPGAVAAQCSPPPGGEPGCARTGNPVNVITGNKYQREVDLPALPGPLGLELVRTYNSVQAGVAGPMGFGWTLSYETRLHKIGHSLQVASADGSYYRFERDGSGACLAASADSGRLKAEPDARGRERFRWTEPEHLGGRTWVFDTDGRAETLIGPDGASATTFQYGPHGELVSVRDPQGRSMTLIYAAAGKPGFRGVVAIETPVGRFAYRYDANGGDRAPDSTFGNLLEAVLPDGSRRSYHYEVRHQANHPHRLTGISIVAQRPGDAQPRTERIATYAYGLDGKTVLSVRGAEDGRIDRTTYTYAAPALPGGYERGLRGKTILTNSRGERTEYTHAVIGGQFRLLDVRGAGCASCAHPNVRYGWTAEGRLASTTQLRTDGRALTAQHYRYDANGRLTSVERIDFDPVTGAAQPPVTVERRTYEGAREEPSLIARPSVVPGKEALVRIVYRSVTHAATGETRDRIESVTEEGFSPAGATGGPLALSRTTRYRYDARGRLVEIDGPLTDADDRIRVQYDSAGRITDIAFPGEHGLRYAYDDLGRPVRLERTGGLPYRFAYDALGRLSAAASASGTERYWYDGAGRLAQVLSATGQRSFFRYDAAGRLVSMSDAQNNRIVLARDGEGALLARSLFDPDGTLAVHAQAGGDLADPLSSARRAARAALHDPASPDAAHRPAIATIADAAGVTARLQFDALNRLLRVVDARARTTEYASDDFGRRVRVVSPDAGATTYRYDAADRLVASTDGAGRTTAYRYDPAGRVVEIAAGTQITRIRYGGHGKPVEIRYPAGAEHFAYDAAGRLIEHGRTIDGHTFTTAYRHDAHGQLIEKRLPDGQTLRYEYRGSQHPRAGTLAAIRRKDWLGNTAILSGLNDPEDRYADRRFELANGLSYHTQLNTDGTLRRVGTPGVAEVGPGWHRLDRHFDPAGNPLQISANGRINRFEIDPLSNRILAETRHGVRDAKAAEVLAYGYDGAGAVTQIGQRRFEHDAHGRLTKVYDGDALRAEYHYNAFGQRIKKVVYTHGAPKTTYFFYDGIQLTAEADGEGRIGAQYVWLDSRPVALLHGQTVYALHADHRGAPLAATDADRRPVWQATVAAWGQATVTRAGLELNLRGSNQYFDAETGLHYNTRRYYDPASGRYLSADPLGLAGGLNLYAFAGNDPLAMVDPLGLEPKPVEDVSKWSFQKRLEYALNDAIGKVPTELAQVLQEMVSPTALATTAAIFAAWGAAQFTPYGWAADLAIAGIGYLFMGKAVVDVFKATIKTYLQLLDAKCTEDLEVAGTTLARGLANAATALGIGGATRVALHMRKAFGNSGKMPENVPTTRRLTDLEDTYGNKIPQFQADHKYAWEVPPASAGIAAKGDALENAAMAFVRGEYKATHVWQPKLPGNQGFDVAYLRPDGKLVIGEAKANSGSISKLTAFDKGSKSVETIDRNLNKLREVIEADPNLTRAQKDSLINQIDQKTFETELYIAPSANVSASRLDVIVDQLGRAMDRVIVIPTLP